MHLWPSKKVRDFFTASHLDFLERNRREKRQSLLLKQTSSSTSFNGYNRKVAGDGEEEGGREGACATPGGGGGGGHGFWKEVLYSCCCLDFWFGCSVMGAAWVGRRTEFSDWIGLTFRCSSLDWPRDARMW
ncbi:hypothetical protein MLD38_024206 [Melastoma candidum]|uniref:Uncharacterized protein n=1 Tax=Melastoma candidum TaxID=119954 RepID=A0ACB9NSX0_9MYRT|nr:hypothetical protein MLD38_024206 [Melastoma candidum]